MQQILSLIYPQFCLHCEEELKEGGILCPHCFSLLEPYPLEEEGVLFCIVKEGPAKDLCLHSSSYQVRKVIAALMVVAIEKRAVSFTHLSPLAKEDKALTRELSKLLKVPVKRNRKRALTIGLTKSRKVTGPAYIFAKEL